MCYLNCDSELQIIRHKQINIKSMKNKKIKSNWFTNKKEEKKKISYSFESQFQQNPQFIQYIENQFNKMTQEKNQNPTLIIPHGFKKFVHSKSFKELLKRIYDYMESYIEFHEQYQLIVKKEDGKGENDPIFKLLRHETNILFAYMGILLGYGDNKMVFKDQYFFETMLYFLTQILQSNFEGSHFLLINEELNRIFRTDAFNLIKRRHIEDEAFRKNPALKEGKYDGTTNSVLKLENRLKLQRKNNYSMQLKTDKVRMMSKPIELSLSTFNSVRSRSPLIASFYPSEKEKLYYFGKEVREKESFIKTSSGRNKFVIKKQSQQYI